MFLNFANEFKTAFENRIWNYLNSEHFEHSVHVHVHFEHFEHLGSRLTVSAPTEPQKGAGGLVLLEVKPSFADNLKILRLQMGI